MPKALFISHIPPFPVRGGDQIRISQQLRSLLEHCDVDIVYLAHHHVDKPMRHYEPRIRRETMVSVPLWRRGLQAARTLFNRQPFEVNLFHNSTMQRHIDSVADDYDLVFCAGMTEAHYMFGHSARPRLLDLTDCFTMNLVNAAAVASGLRRALLRLNADRMRQYERRCLDEFDRVAFISTIDRDYLDYRLDKTAIVGNTVAIAPDDETCRFATSDIVFVGKMDYQPNIDAVRHFATAVLPRVLEQVPRARFVVVGANAPVEISQLASANVVIKGFVDDLAPLYASAGVVVAPMLSGSGIQNKILEPLARGCAVVTTPIGAEGLDTSVGAFAIGHDDQELADHCASLLLDPRRAHALGSAARRYAIATFSPDAIARQFSAFINTMQDRG